MSLSSLLLSRRFISEMGWGRGSTLLLVPRKVRGGCAHPKLNVPGPEPSLASSIRAGKDGTCERASSPLRVCLCGLYLQFLWWIQRRVSWLTPYPIIAYYLEHYFRFIYKLHWKICKLSSLDNSRLADKETNKPQSIINLTFILNLRKFWNNWMSSLSMIGRELRSVRI